MASYRDHLAQASKNLRFLVGVNKNCNEHLDWQVTTSFYVGVHLMNAFLAQEANFHFSSHERVQNAIGPQSVIARTRLDEATYLAYIKLRNLSRRARYLCNENNPSENLGVASFILEKHFLKSFTHLDSLMTFFYKKYGHSFGAMSIIHAYTMDTPNCIYFKFSKSTPQKEVEAPAIGT